MECNPSGNKKWLIAAKKRGYQPFSAVVAGFAVVAGLVALLGPGFVAPGVTLPGLGGEPEDGERDGVCGEVPPEAATRTEKINSI